MPQVLKAIILTILGVLFFTLVDMFVKLLSRELPIGEILIVFGSGTGILFWIMMKRAREPIFDLKFLHKATLMRCSGEMIGAIAFVTALAHTPLSVVTAIMQTAPLILTIMAAIFLREEIGNTRIAAIVVGFAGVIIIVRPSISGFDIFAVVTLIGVIGLATRDISARVLPENITLWGLSFYGSLSVALAGLSLMFFTGGWAVPTGKALIYCSGLVVSGAIGLWCIASSMRMADVSAISPFRYTRVVFGMAAGVIIFDEKIDSFTVIGSVIIILAGLYSWFYERKIASGS